MEIGKEILNQLGGQKFVAMTGANRLVNLGRGLAFQLPLKSTARRINKVCIILTAGDLYDIEFFNVRGLSLRRIETIRGVQSDQLQNIFTAVTGLCVSLNQTY